MSLIRPYISGYPKGAHGRFEGRLPGRRTPNRFHRSIHQFLGSLCSWTRLGDWDSVRTTQCYTRVWMNIHSLLSKGSVRTPTLRRGKNFVSRPHIRNPAPWSFSFETRPSSRITGGGKNGNPTYSNPTTCRCHLDIQLPSFVGPRDVEVLRYCQIKLG